MKKFEENLKIFTKKTQKYGNLLSSHEIYLVDEIIKLKTGFQPQKRKKGCLTKQKIQRRKKCLDKTKN